MIDTLSETKVSADGKTLIFSTFLGGTSRDAACAVSLGPRGEILLAGSTQSTDFPTVNPIQATLDGVVDGFITHLASDGSSLIESIYWGGRGNEGIVLLDPAGEVFVGGQTISTDFPLVSLSPVQPAYAGGADSFVSRPGLAPLGESDADNDGVPDDNCPLIANTDQTDTGGCSCEQIIAAQGLGNGHTKHGCSISAMDDWV